MNRSYYAAPRCPGSLKEGLSSYSPAILRNVFSGKSVFHVLNEQHDNDEWTKAKVEATDFPGQLWFRMALSKNRLLPSQEGNYLLKTIDSTYIGLRFALEQPANEHLCLQVARQVFSIDTLPNALIFFPDGKPAIIYQYNPHMDNFISFENLFNSTVSFTRRLKYYQQAMTLVDQHTCASAIMKERFFIQIIFTWLVTNAIGHMKYSGFVKSVRGDYVIAPLNTIECTRIHQLSDELSLPGGLFEDDNNTPEFREYNHYTRNEFTAFANRSGIPSRRTEKIFDFFISKKQLVIDLVELAFLPEEAKNIFKFNFAERISRLK